jgi:hypothetical protein
MLEIQNTISRSRHSFMQFCFTPLSIQEVPFIWRPAFIALPVFNWKEVSQFQIILSRLAWGQFEVLFQARLYFLQLPNMVVM